MSGKYAVLWLTLLSALGLPVQAQENRVLLVTPSGSSSDRVVLKLSKQIPKLTLVSGSDPEIQALVPVPYSSRPLLAVGRFDQQGRLTSLLWSRDCSQPEAAARELLSFLEDLATRPRIDEVRLLPEGELETGDKLRFEVKGTPASQVQVRLGQREPLPLTEARAGIYLGEYQVKSGERETCSVDIRLENSRGQESHSAGEVTLRGVVMPEVTRVDQIDSYTWLIQGKAAPGALVQARLQLSGYGLEEFSVAADSEGHFQEELDLGRWIPSTTGKFQLSAQDPSGAPLAAQEQSVEFKSSQSLRPVRVVRSNWGYPGWGWGWGPGAWGWGPGSWGWGWGFGRSWGRRHR